VDVLAGLYAEGTHWKEDMGHGMAHGDHQGRVVVDTLFHWVNDVEEDVQLLVAQEAQHCATTAMAEAGLVVALGDRQEYPKVARVQAVAQQMPVRESGEAVGLAREEQTSIALGLRSHRYPAPSSSDTSDKDMR
jgi:hypothetical protein